MLVKKYLALTLAAVLATTMLTACPWDQEEDETDDASSVPVTSTDTSQDDDDHDSGDDDSQPTKPTLTLNGQTITVGQTSEEINVENGAYTVALTQSGGTDGTLTMTIATQPTENYVTNSVTATVDNQSVTWNRNENTATRARTMAVRADTKLSLTTNDEGKTFTLTGIPADATSCTIDVTFEDLGYVIEDGVYKVYDADGLLAWAQSKDVLITDCTLTADITLTDNWTPIGNDSNRYTGTFDGAGHTISGLQVSGGADRGTYIGLFGYVDGGTVENLNLAGVYISGLNFVGGVVGRNKGTITGCMVSGRVSGSDWVGGVVGYDYGGTIMDCYWQAGTGGPSQGVGNGGGDTTEVEGNWTQYADKLKQYDIVIGNDNKPVPSVIANRNNNPEVSGLTQRVLDTARALGL